jgi:hypothetical protein
MRIILRARSISPQHIRKTACIISSAPASGAAAIAESPVALDAYTVFARSADGQIRAATQANGRWSPWNVLTAQGTPPGGFVGNPAVARRADHGLNYPEVAATGADGRVYVISDPGGTWLAWRAVGATPAVTGSPVLLSYDHIFARAASGGAILAATWDGTRWSAWQALALAAPIGGFAGAPATLPGNATAVYALGTDGHLYRATFLSGAWDGWTLVGDAGPHL